MLTRIWRETQDGKLQTERSQCPKARYCLCFGQCLLFTLMNLMARCRAIALLQAEPRRMMLSRKARTN